MLFPSSLYLPVRLDSGVARGVVVGVRRGVILPRDNNLGDERCRPVNHNKTCD